MFLPTGPKRARFFLARYLHPSFIILTALLLAVNLVVPALASIDDELNKKIEKKGEIEEELSDIEEKINNLEGELKELEGKLFVTQKDLDTTTAQANELAAQIDQLETKISDLQRDLEKKANARDAFIRKLYKKNRTPSWEIFFSVTAISRLSKALVYQSVTVSELEGKIQALNAEIKQAEDDKKRLSESKKSLDAKIVRIRALKTEQERQKAQMESEKAEAASKRDALSSELSELSAEIRELVRAKLAATAEDTSVGDTEPARQKVPDPPFSPAYAVYSRGYPHRVGLNQYGAKGRAEAGQDYREILKAYYKDIKIEDYDCPDKIKITGSFGVRELGFEDEYMKGIAEMPSDWPMEALKAQAIAARTYALSYTHDGEGTICTTQSCQVWLESKVDSSAAKRWHEAVDETKGKVITYDGSPIKAWYASTAGGATRLPTDFDVKWSHNPPYVKRVIDNPTGDMDHWSDSYDRDSPWFYKAWYSPSHDKHPWLTEEEMQDLLNATLLYSKDHDLEDNLVQEDPVVSSKKGWSKEKVRKELEERGIDPIGEIEEITPYDSKEGYTNKILVFSENYEKGIEINGKDFRKIFVIRSPGYLALWSSLYDIVRK